MKLFVIIVGNTNSHCSVLLLNAAFDAHIWTVAIIDSHLWVPLFNVVPVGQTLTVDVMVTIQVLAEFNTEPGGHNVDVSK